MVSSLTFQSLIHLKLIFVPCKTVWFHSVTCDYSVSQRRSLKRPLLSLLRTLARCQTWLGFVCAGWSLGPRPVPSVSGLFLCEDLTVLVAKAS